MTYLVDTDYVVDYLKGQRGAPELLNSLLEKGLAISIITYAEIYEGIYYGQNRTHYEKGLRQFLQGVDLLGITRSTARQYAIIRGDLRKKGILIAQPDIFIAATAIQHNLTLITRNLKDYQRIAPLQIYHRELVK